MAFNAAGFTAAAKGMGYSDDEIAGIVAMKSAGANDPNEQLKKIQLQQATLNLTQDMKKASGSSNVGRFLPTAAPSTPTPKAKSTVKIPLKPIVQSEPEQAVRKSLAEQVGNGLLDFFIPATKKAFVKGTPEVMNAAAKSGSGKDTKGNLGASIVNAAKQTLGVIPATFKAATPAAVELASYKVPFGKAGFKGSKFIAPGAAVGAMQGIAKGDKPVELIGDTALGAAGAGAMQGAGKVIGKLLPKIGNSTSKVGDRLEKHVLNPIANSDPFYSENITKLTKTAKKYGLTGKAAIDSLDDMPRVFKGVEEKISTKLAGNKTPVKLENTISNFDDLFSKNSSVGAGDPAFETARNSVADRLINLGKSGKGQTILDASGKPIVTPKTASDLYKLKSELRGELTSAFKKLDTGNGNLTPVEEAKMSMWEALKNSINEVEPSIRQLNADEHDMFELAKGLVKSANRKGGIGFGAIKLPIPNQFQQNISSKIGKAAGIVGDKIGSPLNVNGIGTQIAGQSAARLPLIGGNDNQVDNNYSYNNNPENHATLPAIPEYTPESQATAYATGYSPEQLTQALSRATAAGDSEGSAEIQKLLDAEYKYQESNNGGGKPLSGANAKDLNKAQTALKAIDTLDRTLSSDPSVLLKKMNPLDQSGRQVGNDITSAIDLLGYFRTGATITPEQRKDYINLFPKVLDSEATRRKKIEALRAEFQGYATGLKNAGTTSEAMMPAIQ